MNFFFLHPPVKTLTSLADKNIQMPVQASQQNITEGGEFLDDALRMTEQPLMYTEESIAPGSPKDLF